MRPTRHRARHSSFIPANEVSRVGALGIPPPMAPAACTTTYSTLRRSEVGRERDGCADPLALVLGVAMWQIVKAGHRLHWHNTSGGMFLRS